MGLDCLAFVSNFLRFSGPNNPVLDLGNYLSRKAGIEFSVCTHAQGDSSFEQLVTFPVHRKLIGSSPELVPRVGSAPANVVVIRRLLGKLKPDRVIFFEALPRHPGGPVQKDYLRERVRIRGHAWKFGRNMDTDAIIPARHCNTADPRELALHCMEDADANFVKKMRRGDLIVADSNFGCGSSREVAPLTIKAAGVSAVVAKSFARIFFRNAINIGLPILECPQAVDGIREGDEVEVEPAAGVIRNLTTGAQYQAVPFPDFLRRIIDVGGLLAYAEERLAKSGR